MTERNERTLERASDGLSIVDAAEEIGVHHQTIRNWINADQLRVWRFGPTGGIIRLHPEDVADLRHPPDAEART